jgi:RNA polymerase sigma factor (sigma-70 family)
MANEAAHLLAKHLGTLSAAARTDSVPDGEFLQRFAAQRDEDAFATLVRRHGPMVLRVCQRVLHDAHAAEDAFQAAFLVLSRKAASLRHADSVGCWLHQVAYRLALKARTQLSWQRIHDFSAAVEKPADDPLAQLTVREAQTILDEELARLPEKYSAPLVLCYLEGKTRDEAARQLGWPVKLVKSRLEQGRERLRYRLSRRNLTLPATLIGTLLTEEAPAALPAALIRAAVQAARAWPANGVSASVALLAESALRGPGALKATVVMGLLLLASVVAARVGGFAAPPPAVKPAEPAKPEKPQAARTLRVVVLDPQGKPLPDAKVHAGIWTNEKGFRANHDYQTDAAGAAQVELPKSFYILRLWASKRPFVTLFAGWEQNELASGMKLPAEYTFRLERGVAAGGRIVDEQGTPIAGAKVQVSLAGDPRPARSDGRTRYNTWLAVQHLVGGEEQPRDDRCRGPLAHRQRPGPSARAAESAGFPSGLCVRQPLAGSSESSRPHDGDAAERDGDLEAQARHHHPRASDGPRREADQGCAGRPGRRPLLLLDAQQVPDRR